MIAEPRPRDIQSEAIVTFNETVASDSRIKNVMLPIRDGITISVKK